MSVLGLEPRTNSLKGYCSAIELYAHFFERQTILTCTPESVNRNHKTHYFFKFLSGYYNFALQNVTLFPCKKHKLIIFI